MLVREYIEGTGCLEDGVGEADLRNFLVENDGDVQILKLTPKESGEVDFEIEVLFSVDLRKGDFEAVSAQLGAGWRMEQLLEEHFVYFEISEKAA